MPTQITSGTSQVNLTSDDFYFLNTPDVLVSSTNGIVFSSGSDNATLFVSGTIFADERGIFGETGDNITINIADSATIVAQSVGVGLSEDDATLINRGDITSLTSIGVNLEFFSAGGTSFTNYGTVSGDNIGTAIQGNSQYVVNHGSISGEVGVRFSGEGSSFINYGTVTGSSVAEGASSYGVLVTNLNDGNVTWNFGTITGLTASFFVDGSVEDTILNNHGLMVGDVVFGERADIYRAGADGVVVGRILANEGDDFVRGGHQADDIDGGDDNDILIGRGGDDIILGGEGEDTIKGGIGDDILAGDDGDDEIRGGSGSDDITGGEGRDLLYGGNDDDVLSGSAGRDTLNGGNGDDTLDGGGASDILSGGRGDDVLTGGTGSDVFVFRGNGGRDTVTDFVNGVDRIDLSDFGQFSFASLTANFTVDLHGPNGSFIDFGNGDVLILETMVFGNLDSSDFIF